MSSYPGLRRAENRRSDTQRTTVGAAAVGFMAPWAVHPRDVPLQQQRLPPARKTFGRRTSPPRVPPSPVPGARPVPKAVPRMPGVGFWGPALILAPFLIQQVIPVKNLRWRGTPNLPDPGRWALKHGINEPVKFYAPNYWGGPEYWSTNAYGSTGEGPGTGLISGQSISVGGPVPGTYTGTGTNIGWWVKHDTLNRYAQVAAFIKRSTVQNPDYRQSLRDQLGPDMIPAPIGPYAPPLPDLVIEGEPALDPAPSVKPDSLQGIRQRFGLEPGTAFDLAPDLWPEPWRATRPGDPSPWRPSPEPGWSFTPGGPPKRTPPYHASRPGPRGSRKRQKERKGKADKALWSAMNAFGGLTEFNDLVSSAHKALPPKYRAHSYYDGKPIKPGWQKQWQAVYQHWDKIRLDEFIKNVAENHLEDYAIGKANKTIENALPWRPDSVSKRAAARAGVKHMLGL